MIIGIAGYAGAGKDTMFSLLEKYGSRKYKRFAFADALKREIRDDLLKETGIDILNATREEKISVRKQLVDLGAGRREENQNYWVEKLEQDLDAADPQVVSVITDVRYINEAEWVMDKKGGFLITVSRVGGKPANMEESEFTTPVINLDRPGVKHINWFDIALYSEPQLKRLIEDIEYTIFG